MAECSVSTPLTTLRREIRRKNASFQECFDFMKTYGIKQDETDGELVNAAESLRNLTYLRNELPLSEAVTFLKMYLDWLGQNVFHKNLIYFIEIGLLIGEDLEEVLRYSEAQDQYKQILEWISKHGPCKTAEALAISKLAVLAYRLDSKREGKQYYRQCFEILQGVMEQKEKSRFPMPDVEMKFAMNAFVTCGEFLRFLGKYDSARKFFLRALDYCPENANTVLNRCTIYAQLYRNERSSTNFQNSNVPTKYEGLACENMEAFLHGGQEAGDMNDMTQFLHAVCLINACKSIQECVSQPNPVIIELCNKISAREYQEQVLLYSKINLDPNWMKQASKADVWKTHSSNALYVAICAQMLLEIGQVEYRTFKEQAKKHVAHCKRLLDENPSGADVLGCTNLIDALGSMVLICIREHKYSEGEERAREALDMTNLHASHFTKVPSYEEFKGNILFLSVCLYHFLRGRVKQVKGFSKLALNYYEESDEKTKVLILKRLLESFDLPK